MSRYATGKRSKAICDRCGLSYQYDQLKEEVQNRRPTGVRVCPTCFDGDHPQNQLGTVRVSDPEALLYPRRDRIEPESNVIAFQSKYPHTAGANSYSLSGTVANSTFLLNATAAVTAVSAVGMISSFTQTTAGTTDTSVTNYTVTVASGTNSYGTGNKYYVAGLSGASPTLTLSEGNTYRFDQSHSSNSSHPLRFSTTANGTHGGGSEYTTGVTTNGTAGNAGAYVQITVPSGAPTLYYYCTNHSGMGGTANTP